MKIIIFARCACVLSHFTAWFLPHISCSFYTRVQTFLLSLQMPQNSFHIHSINMCVCVSENEKKTVQKVTLQNGKKNVYFHSERLNLVQSKRKWTLNCVFVVCTCIWYSDSDKKYKKFFTRNFQSMQTCFHSSLFFFCHFVYSIYNSYSLLDG